MTDNTSPFAFPPRPELTECDMPKYLGMEAVFVHLDKPVMGHRTVFAADMSLLPHVGLLLSETQWGDDSVTGEPDDDPDSMLNMLVPLSNVRAVQPAHTETVTSLDDETQIKETIRQLDDAWNRLNNIALLHDNNPQEHKLPVSENILNQLIHVSGELREALHDLAGTLDIDLNEDENE